MNLRGSSPGGSQGLKPRPSMSSRYHTERFVPFVPFCQSLVDRLVGPASSADCKPILKQMLQEATEKLVMIRERFCEEASTVGEVVLLILKSRFVEHVKPPATALH